MLEYALKKVHHFWNSAFKNWTVSSLVNKKEFHFATSECILSDCKDLIIWIEDGKLNLQPECYLILCSIDYFLKYLSHNYGNCSIKTV